MFPLKTAPAPIVVGVLCAINFAGGYWLHGALNPLPPPSKPVQAAATAAIAQTDKAATTKLAGQIKAADTSEAARIIQIQEAAHATPALAPDCRLPDGLRDALNADLSAGAGQPAGSVP